MIFQNKNVKVKLAKNILESQFTFLNNKLFFDDLSLTDQTLIFSGVKILDLKGNELLYVNNLNIKFQSYSQLKSKKVNIKSIELVEPKLYLVKYSNENVTNLELFLKSIEIKGLIEKLKIQNLIVSNSSIDYRLNYKDQISIVKNLNFVFDEIAINSDSLNISLQSASFQSKEIGNLKNASLKLNKVHDNLYVDGLDIIHNKYLFNGKGDLSYCMGNSSNFLENMIINNFSIAASIPKNAFSSYEFPQDLQIKNIFSGTIKNLFSKFKITFSNESFSEGSITIKFNSIDDVSLVGEKIYTILQKDDLNKFVKTNAPDFLSGEFKLLNNLELTTNFRTILNSFTLIDSKFNIENGYIKSNIGLEKLDGNWKIKHTNSFHDFSLYSFYQKLGKMKVNGISTINTLVSDFKKIGFLDLKVSLDSFEFNNQKLSDISILLNKKSNERYNLKTNINDENLKLVLSSSLSAQFEKILNL